MRKYYSVVTEERAAEIAIFGDITSYPYLESDVAAYNLQKEIQSLDVDRIDVHINSYGGEVAEALAITNTLMRHQAEVTTYVDGFACSAATIIFMAGSKRVVSPASNFLVHPASAFMMSGNAEDFRREANNLDAITEQSVTMYMTGVLKSREELLELMAEERFLTPQEVLEWGFATEIDDLLEEKKNPTQTVRDLVSRLCQSAKPYEPVFDYDAVAEKIAQKLKEPDPIPEPEETVLDRFFNAFK